MQRDGFLPDQAEHDELVFRDLDDRDHRLVRILGRLGAGVVHFIKRAGHTVRAIGGALIHVHVNNVDVDHDTTFTPTPTPTRSNIAAKVNSDPGSRVPIRLSIDRIKSPPWRLCGITPLQGQPRRHASKSHHGRAPAHMGIAMNALATNRTEWWHTTTIYQIYPRSFQDSNRDGVGDLRGIVRRLDYLAELGIGAIWLSPIFRSPMADFGYDISDYTDVDPLFGTLADFDELLRAAHRRG